MRPANILFDNTRLRRLQPAFSELYAPPPYKEDAERANAVIDLRKDIWAPTLPVPSLVKIMDRLTAIKEFLDNIDTQDSQHGWRFLLGIYLVALIGSGPAADSHTGHDGICFEYFRFATWGVQSQRMRQLSPS
ncbi:uncharacterized protein N7446_003995 [Penicillium canescens]|uniref:uncharacterized protein n=1 Tax=Penicillium canescens TaxID=5083 RepID=UPI0026E022CD|nr:uncharacterized protein N7446_003995 [Penicillium canescens]KAJ6040690.1 hypothetical protein N7444_009595 [Penicillium canescens]KAJ6066958.1 hypothetical protein N7446_003995 [Penicillium canescens]